MEERALPSGVLGPRLCPARSGDRAGAPSFEAGAEISLAGGQSGNPLSPFYADWLLDWRDGKYRTIVQPERHILSLIPQ